MERANPPVVVPEQTGAPVAIEWVSITGAKGEVTGGQPRASTGVGVTMGSASNNSRVFASEIFGNEAAGVSGAKGVLDRVELFDNTTNPAFVGFTGAGVKGVTEYEIKNSYVHDNNANGIWCDSGCVDAPERGANGFWVHDNLAVNNARAGVRYENAPQSLRPGVHAAQPTALIENNEIHGNSASARRGGVSIADAQNALVRGNIFGVKIIAGVAYQANGRREAIIATDSGRRDRTDLWNVDIENNVLNGEVIKGCELPDNVVACTGNR